MLSARARAASGSGMGWERWGREECGFHPGGGGKPQQAFREFCHIWGNADDDGLSPELMSGLNVIINVSISSWRKAWCGVEAQ